MNYFLCIGINDYPDTNSDLAGCVPDAKGVAQLAESRGFKGTVLLDSDATKSNIVEALRAGVSKTGWGKTFLVHYSGHGTRVPDLSGDEIDRYDEALCPHDIYDAKLILDDEIAEIFNNKNFGARIVLISDSCHSGTVQRLHSPLMHGPSSSSKRNIRFLPPSIFMDHKSFARTDPYALVPPSNSKAKVRKAVSLLMSGCRDEEYSYDAWFDGKPNGAFTYVALEAWRVLQPLEPEASMMASMGIHAGPTYQQWWERIRTMLPSQDFPQTPQLQGELYRKQWKALA